MRKTDEIVMIPLKVEHFLRNVLGYKSTHGLAGSSSKREWTKQCRRLVTHLKKYIDANIDTDKIHFERIKLQIDQMNEALGSEAAFSRDQPYRSRMCERRDF